MHAGEANFSGKIGSLSTILASKIILRDWHKCRRHCSNILYINMLAIEHEEYSILISEVCNMADLICSS
ncbi:hypothetical protein T4D_14013 [Trichinella pseudospiralis]|uniref:Uncharacterized protein n=2 Tax=Trichinella pseudospiralis TaxID=6337 RepID=A0A0V1FE12_TRIPS|nr:hypothetical protein T4D_14013 [Trichinella pseudospiralis]